MIDIEKYGQQFLEDYNNNDFEVILTKYRKKRIIELLEKYNTDSMLEVGCGMDPFFKTYDNYKKMIVVEPASIMFDNAERNKGNDSRITCIHDFIENQVKKLKSYSFDFILLVGLIHEVEDPERLICSVKSLCDKDTKLLVTTNNPNSFHLTLAYEAGIIDKLGGLSQKAKTYQRHQTFTMDGMIELLEKNGFSILEKGGYFVKPFAHSQMKALLDQKIITMDVIDGLDRMIKYMPELAAENFCVVELIDS